jgi:hypothetical protein
MKPSQRRTSQTPSISDNNITAFQVVVLVMVKSKKSRSKAIPVTGREGP